MLHNLTDPLLTLAYPQACFSCGADVKTFDAGIACEICWKKTRIFTGSDTLCQKCGAFLRSGPSDFQTFCHRCDDHAYDRAAAVGLYEFALSASILNLKREPFVAPKLRELFTVRFQTPDFYRTDVIVPVPLSKRRRFERGFNQAEVLAGVLVRKTGLKLDNMSLLRRLHTPMHRAGMDRKERARTVAGAFWVRRKNLIEGRNILLIDDVLTSGATVSSCAEALKNAGAAAVNVLTAARTP